MNAAKSSHSPSTATITTADPGKTSCLWHTHTCSLLTSRQPQPTPPPCRLRLSKSVSKHCRDRPGTGPFDISRSTASHRSFSCALASLRKLTPSPETKQCPLSERGVRSHRVNFGGKKICGGCKNHSHHQHKLLCVHSLRSCSELAMAWDKHPPCQRLTPRIVSIKKHWLRYATKTESPATYRL